MQFDVTPKPSGKHILLFHVTNNGYELPEIKGGTYGAAGYSDLKKLFTPVNELLTYLGPAVQDKVFDEYEKIFQLLAEFKDINDGTLDAVSDGVKTIFELIEPSQVTYFIKNQKNSIYVPEDLSDKLEEHHTADKTYVSADYVPLIALGLCTQMLLPIWATICNLVKDIVGTRQKELYCMYILHKSNIVELEGYRRLLVFVGTLTDKVKIPFSINVNSAMSDHTLNKWAMAQAVVRKLVTTEFCDPNTKVVNNIYSTLDNKLRNLQGAFNDYSNDKHRYTRDTSNSQDESGNASLLDDFKRKSKIPLGYRSAIQNYVRCPERILRNMIEASSMREELAPKKDLMVKDAESLASYLRNQATHEITPYALGVMGMLLKTQFHPAALLYVDYNEGINVLLASCYVYLKYAGFKEPQLYMFALEEESAKRTNVRYSLTKDTAEKVRNRFPYEYNNSKLSQEQSNPGLAHIAKAVSNLSLRFWVTNLNRREIRALGHESNNLPLTPTSLFKEEYAKLVIHTTYFKYDVVHMQEILDKKY